MIVTNISYLLCWASQAHQANKFLCWDVFFPSTFKFTSSLLWPLNPLESQLLEKLHFCSTFLSVLSKSKYFSSIFSPFFFSIPFMVSRISKICWFFILFTTSDLLFSCRLGDLFELQNLLWCSPTCIVLNFLDLWWKVFSSSVKFKVENTLLWKPSLNLYLLICCLLLSVTSS